MKAGSCRHTIIPLHSWHGMMAVLEWLSSPAVQLAGCILVLWQNGIGEHTLRVHPLAQLLMQAASGGPCNASRLTCVQVMLCIHFESIKAECDAS
jgi:hypothetical protein